MSTKLKLLALGIISVLFYVFVVPPVKDFFSERRQADLDRSIAEAEKEGKLARKKAEADLKTLCTASNVTVLSDTQSDTDGGTKAHANVTARITAKNGSFILASTITRNHTGSREFRWEEYRTTPHKLAKTSGQKATFLQSASLEVQCNKHNTFGTSSCTSTATISGKEFHNDCIKYILDRDAAAMTGN